MTPSIWSMTHFSVQAADKDTNVQIQGEATSKSALNHLINVSYTALSLKRSTKCFAY